MGSNAPIAYNTPLDFETFTNYCQLQCNNDDECTDLFVSSAKCDVIDSSNANFVVLEEGGDDDGINHLRKETTTTLTVQDVFLLNYLTYDHVVDESTNPDEPSLFDIGYLSNGFNTGNALSKAKAEFLSSCTTFVDQIYSGTSCESIENAYNDNIWGESSQSISGIKIIFTGPHDQVAKLRYHILGPCHTDQHKECWDEYRYMTEEELSSNIPTNEIIAGLRGGEENIVDTMSSPTPLLVGLLYPDLNAEIYDAENPVEGSYHHYFIPEASSAQFGQQHVMFHNIGTLLQEGLYPSDLDQAASHLDDLTQEQLYKCRCGLELGGYLFHDVAPAGLGYTYWPTPSNQEYYPWITDIVDDLVTGYGDHDQSNNHSTGLYSGPLCVEGVLSIDGTVCCDKCYDSNGDLNCNQSGPTKNDDCTTRYASIDDIGAGTPHMEPNQCCPNMIIDTHRACQHPDQVKCVLASSNSYGCRSSANMLNGVVLNSCSSCVTETVEGIGVQSYCAEATCEQFEQGFNFFPKQGCKACENDGKFCINWPTCATFANEEDDKKVDLKCRVSQAHDNNLAWVFYLRSDPETDLGDLTDDGVSTAESLAAITPAEGNEASCFKFASDGTLDNVSGSNPPGYLNTGFQNLRINQNSINSDGSLTFSIPNIQGPSDSEATTYNYQPGDGECWHGDNLNQNLWYLLFTAYQIAIPDGVPTEDDYKPTKYNIMQQKDYRLFVRKRTSVDGSAGGEGGDISILDELDINIFTVDFNHDIEIKIRSSCDAIGELSAVMPGEPYVAVTQVKHYGDVPSIEYVDEIAIDVFKQQGSNSEFVFVAGGVEKFGRLFSRFMRYGDKPCIEFVPMSKVFNEDGEAIFYVTGELTVGDGDYDSYYDNPNNDLDYDLSYNNGNGRRLKGKNSNRRILQASTTSQEAAVTVNLLDANTIVNSESSVNGGQSQMQQKKFPFVVTLVVVSSVVVTAALVVLGMVLHASKSSSSVMSSTKA